MSEESPDCNGGPAYPAPEFAVPEDLKREGVFKLRDLQGMSVRQWYKGLAMQALLSNPWWMEEYGYTDVVPMVARRAASYADAMLSEDREPEEGSDD